MNYAGLGEAIFVVLILILIVFGITKYIIRKNKKKMFNKIDIKDNGKSSKKD